MKKILFLLVLFTQLHTLAQNVGIGTDNPTKAKLEVHGAVGATSAIFGGESSGISLQRNWPGIGFNQYYNGGSRYISNGFAAVQFVDPSSGHMVFDMFGSGTANSIASATKRAMIITNDGRVTIGSADYPPATLYVARGNAVDGTAVFSGTVHRSHFNYGNDEHTYIRAGKNNSAVIINDIPGGKTIIYNAGVNSGNIFGYPMEILQNNDRGLLLKSGGDRWGISVDYNFLTLTSNDVVKGYFSYSDGKYTSISDGRLKTNIRELSPLLKKIMQLNPVDYEMIHHNPSHKKSIGFIAQDVQKLFPELVAVIPNSSAGYKNINDLHTLDYSGFGVIAVKAIQEQQKIIDDMSKRIQLLEEQNKLLLQLLKK